MPAMPGGTVFWSCRSRSATDSAWRAQPLAVAPAPHRSNSSLMPSRAISVFQGWCKIDEKDKRTSPLTTVRHRVRQVCFSTRSRRITARLAGEIDSSTLRHNDRDDGDCSPHTDDDVRRSLLALTDHRAIHGDGSICPRWEIRAARLPRLEQPVDGLWIVVRSNRRRGQDEVVGNGVAPGTVEANRRGSNCVTDSGGPRSGVHKDDPEEALAQSVNATLNDRRLRCFNAR